MANETTSAKGLTLPPIQEKASDGSNSKAPGIRSTLSLLVIACVLPILALTAYLVDSSYEREVRKAKESSIVRARAMISVVDRDLARTEAALLALSTASSLTDDKLAEFYTRARRTLEYIHADSIVLLDANGQLLVSTRFPFGEPLPKLAKLPLLVQSIATGKSNVSELFVSPITGKKVITVAVPIKKDGVVVRSLNANIDPAQLSLILKEQKLPDTWRAAITDAKGIVVARSHEPEKYIGMRVPPLLMESMARVNENAYESFSLDGIPVITSYSRSNTTNWTMVIGEPLKELTAEAQKNVIWLSVAALLAIGSGLFFAWLIGGRIARSFSALVPPAEALGKGQVLDSIPRLAIREANNLGEALYRTSLALQAAHADLSMSESELRQAQRFAKIGNWTWNTKTDAVQWSGEMYRIFGRDPALPPNGIEALAKSFTPETWADLGAAIEQAIENRQPYECEAEILRADGSRVWVLSRGEPMYDSAGEMIGLRGTTQDLTERFEKEELHRKEKLNRHQALHDALTGLPNRVLLMNRVEHAIVCAQREKTHVAVLFIDLDRFKAVNDTRGHDAGDAVLKTVAVRMNSLLRQSDTVARLGGDEFVVLLENVNDIRSCGMLARKLIDQISQPVPFGGSVIHVGASIGIACYPEHAADAVQILKNADVAMYAAKSSGRNAYSYFDADAAIA
jgi:diguanylate cyclase (GGDEF)-like protein/PAS domain S-box-containing protein